MSDPDIKHAAPDYGENHLDKLIDLALFLEIHGVYDHDADIMGYDILHIACTQVFFFLF
jgi:hypothetical protein